MLVGVLVGFAPRADASAITGTATGTVTVTNVQQTVIGHHGGDTYYYETFTATYNGGLSGTTLNWDVYIRHSNGVLTTQVGYQSCASCTIGGRTGGYTAEWNFLGSDTNGITDLIITRGFGGLTGLVGGGIFLSNATGSYTMTYELP
jgi:hypothetical protein